MVFHKFYISLYITFSICYSNFNLTAEIRSALQANGASFILDHFNTFFSIIVHGNKVELAIIMRAFTRIQKGNKILLFWLLYIIII